MFLNYPAIGPKHSFSHRLLGAMSLAVAVLAGISTADANGQTSAPAVAVAPASGTVNLNITPKRLVLDRGKRGGTAYIFNQGSTPATVDITLVDRVMLPDGEIKPVADVRGDPQLQPIVDKLSSAQPLLQAAPRRVTLAPGQGQTIRIRALPRGSASGEYRTHLTVTTVPPRDSGVTADQAQAVASNQLGFRINSTFGLSIPVIVRPGAADARGGLDNARVDFANLSSDGVTPVARTAVVRLDIRRLGSSSLFGNLEVKGGNGREVLGFLRGVGVYVEIDRRSIQVPLRRTPRPGEQLTVTFTDDDSSPGQVIAKTVLNGS